MSYNGSGVFSIGSAGFPFVTATEANANHVNAALTDLANGLSLAICRDGQSTITQPINFGGNRIIEIGAASARTDAARVSDVCENRGQYGTVGGSANAMTLTPIPAATALVAGSQFWLIVGTSNTAAVTVAVSGLSPVTVKKMGTVDLVAGDLVAGALVGIVHDGTNFQLITPPIAQGAWTPSLGGDTTYASRTGLWTKNGRAVTIYGSIVVSVLGTGSATTISGLPYTSSAANQALSVSDFGSLATNVVWIGARVNAAATTIALRNLTAAGASATSSNLFGDGASLVFGGTYFI